MLPILALADWKPVSQVFGAVGDALGIGGKSDAEKAQIRVARASELLDCAQRGDVAAARTVLAEQTYSSQPEGRAAYSQAWQQLLVTRPDVAATAQQQGALRDSTSSGACTRFELGSIPFLGSQSGAPSSSSGGASAPVMGAASPGASSQSSGLILAGVGALALLALTR